MRSSTIDYEVVSDGSTVWVNSADGCIGRFGRNGIDVHRVASDQAEGECLYCTHEETNAHDYETFVEKMAEFYGVAVGFGHAPSWLARSYRG